MYVRSRLRELNESSGNGLGPIERIMFDQVNKSTVQMRVEAHRLVQQLWDILSDTTPDLVSIETTGILLQETLANMDKSF